MYYDINIPMTVQDEKLMKWEQSFRELLDEIYYEGYAAYLLEEDPDAYRREYDAFIALYDYQPY
jgi:hypothetical protein